MMIEHAGVLAELHTWGDVHHAWGEVYDNENLCRWIEMKYGKGKSREFIRNESARVFQLADKMIAPHMSAVHWVARALLKHRTLSGRQVRGILHDLKENPSRESIILRPK
ncbi:MAG: hypothetical protein PVI86_11440 [Phycisphaerae bacterium]|jgi:hypothetical protein